MGTFVPQLPKWGGKGKETDNREIYEDAWLWE